MRILDISQSYPNTQPENIGGVHIHRQNMALHARGWQIKVINPQLLLHRRLTGVNRYYPHNSIHDGIDVWRPLFFWPLWMKMRGQLFDRAYAYSIFRILPKILRGWKPELVVCDWIIPGGLAASKIAEKLDIPLIFKVHSMDIHTIKDLARRSPAHESYYREMGEAAARIVCNGPGLYDEVSSSKLYDEDKIVSIPIGVDTQIFYPCPNNDKRQIRKNLGLDLEHIVILFAGTWETRKGTRDLVVALKNVLMAHANLSLTIAGPVKDQESRDDLESFATQNGIHNRIQFWGAVRPSEVASFMKASDIFVLPSYREGLPSALLEAMACGLVVICTPVGGIPKVIAHGKNGLLVDIGDQSALVDALTICIADSDLRHRYGVAAQQTILTGSYDLSTVADRLHGLFTSVIQEHVAK